jgi:hypothetical protein
MKTRGAWFCLLALVALALGAFAFKPPAGPAALRKVVVVELFTSEGCSSCPPADELLARLQGNHTANGAEIVPLGFHVDYWDAQGWRDRFSSHSYTERQEIYATRFKLESPYTPEMVVDGSSEFVGNDSGRAQHAIAQATTQPQKADVQLSWTNDQKLMVHVNSEESGAADVMLAISEDNLSSNVGAGENQGHVLHHAAVVRDLRRLGHLKNGQFQADVTLKAAKDWKTKDLHVVAFVQSANGGPILGAATVDWNQATGQRQ